MAEYIDRHITTQAIKEHIRLTNERLASTDIPSYLQEAYIMAQWHCMDLVSLIPAADVVEWKEGKWIENGEPNAHGKYELWYYTCNLCGAVGVQQYNYCPNCGARMVNDG